MPPNGTDGDAAVGFAAPRTAPVLEAQELLGRFLHEGLDRILIAEPVAARDGVVGVLVEAVVGRDGAGGAALGGDGVAAHRVDLGDDGDTQPGIGLGDGDRGAQARAAAAHEHDVMRRGHVLGYSAEMSSSTSTWPSCRTILRLNVPS